MVIPKVSSWHQIVRMDNSPVPFNITLKLNGGKAFANLSQSTHRYNFQVGTVYSDVDLNVTQNNTFGLAIAVAHISMDDRQVRAGMYLRHNDALSYLETL